MKSNSSNPCIIKIAIHTVLLIIISVIALGIDSNAQTGLRKGEAVIDPADKQNISGYIHIAFAWGDQLIPPQHMSRGLMNLTSAMNLWTKIETKIDAHLFLSSPRLLQMPFVYVTTTDAFELSETEKKNVKKFFDNGGFMVLETATPLIENNQARAALKQMVRDTLGHARFAPIPMDHELFHCYFDFEDRPPLGAEIGARGVFMNKTINYLEGVWYKGRLAAVYSDKGYIVRWTELSNNFPQLKMGINMIVYSLIQDGGMASKSTK
ncbi:DUF4159 domain-containing protein [Candidatus Latescibacterota bacterium]